MGKWQNAAKHHLQDSQEVGSFLARDHKLQGTDKTVWQTNMKHKYM